MGDIGGQQPGGGDGMIDGHEDCRYWGLTNIQCMRYHGRIARWYGERAKCRADQAARLARISHRLAFVAVALLLASAILQLVAQ